MSQAILLGTIAIIGLVSFAVVALYISLREL